METEGVCVKNITEKPTYRYLINAGIYGRPYGLQPRAGRSWKVRYDRSLIEAAHRVWRQGHQLPRSVNIGLTSAVNLSEGRSGRIRGII